MLCATLLTTIAGAALPSATTQLPFYENFEPVKLDGTSWSFLTEWLACDSPANRKTTCPVDPMLPKGWPNPAPNDAQTWGPYKFETWPDEANGGRVFSGQRSGRQPIWDPMWAAILHVFDPPLEPGHLRAKTQFYDPADILCDCDPWGPPSRPNFDDHGWLILTEPNRTEYFVLAVNSKISWEYYSWATMADGWHITPVPRTQGWHRLEIVVHPYSGAVGDVEFLIDGVVISQGRRMPGQGNGIDVTWLRLGGDPRLLTEGYLTNTFEEFWYDEVALTFCRNEPRFDTDRDGDVDHADFGIFQACLSGPANAFVANPPFDGSACQCLDADGDRDADADDLAVFTRCYSGPTIPAFRGCDNPAP
ncbi:MAG TPA: hypothetical protein PKY77_18030 [Phycisphaerae bacterium]|nr:hypothetical protein [Phycisphaerae bacterium]HRY70248.1 hypothetical protein [Phycisphaerae bacterium]HSA27581.1 hypothetical protein [Phycisphaerae bacterium]